MTVQELIDILSKVENKESEALVGQGSHEEGGWHGAGINKVDVANKKHVFICPHIIQKAN